MKKTKAGWDIVRANAAGCVAPGSLLQPCNGGREGCHPNWVGSSTYGTLGAIHSIA